MKRIVFFDGDGTLWYPSSTKRHRKPHWIYAQRAGYKEHLVVTPTTRRTLTRLRQRGVLTILLSTHPHPPRTAVRVLSAKVAHLKLAGLFDELHPTRSMPHSKTLYIRRVLKRYGIPMSQALMVGDSYRWDYLPAQRAGIDAVLLDSSYRRADKHGRRVRRVINETRDVFEYM